MPPTPTGWLGRASIQAPPNGVPISPMEVLPEIVDKVGSSLDVFVDSGFRRGADIAKALALGAKGVMVGRAPLWGVAAAGEPGAALALEILREELERVLGLLGCPSVAALSPALIRNAGTAPEPARTLAAATQFRENADLINS